jgi:CubicO group peptidase (beta-lactamase class C family)
MSLIPRRAAAALLFVILSTQLLAAPKAESLDALLKKYSALKQFNGTALVADASGVIFRKGYGYANFEWEIPNTPDVKFRLGSITKQFTSMVVMQLVAEGKIKLDDKITAYLPDYRKDTGDKVTIAQLLNHTSGIPSYTSQPGFFQEVSRDPYTVGDFVKKYTSGDLTFEPGSKWSYNNSGYFLLGAIIEKVTGKPYATVMQERIFGPLGMTSSGYDLASPVLAKRASGYQLQGGTYVNAPYLDMSIPYAAGSLYSTVDDLYLWDRALYGDKLLGADLKQQLFTPTQHDYGFGWVIVRKQLLDDGKTAVETIGHDGGINGFNTVLIRVPERKELVVLLDNTSRGDKLDALALSLLSILHDITPKQPKKSIVEELGATAKDGNGAAIVTRYRELRKQHPQEYDFREGELNSLGYSLVGQNRLDDAIEVFKLNVEMFPTSFNPYDSLGEAYAAKGLKDLAIQNYQKSYELNHDHKGALEAIARLEKPEAKVDTKYPNEAFVGKYELAPTFILAFFIEDGKLMTQATGQPKIGLKQESATEFSVIGVPARVVFEMDAAGKATTVTLFQNGREMKAKRIE